MKPLNFSKLVVLTAGFLILANVAYGNPIPWDIKTLSIPPKVFEFPERTTSDVKAIFYESVPWEGKPTRVFAYYGLPKTAGKEKVPAMVLVHGGGGSAFIPWVQLWVSRGYAAISMDTCGCISSGGYNNHPRHEFGGPAGWGGFGQIDQPIEEQWTYHAVADIILANSLIRSFPQVDPEKVGITGISWGGYLTCIVAGVDHRFKFSAPVYGCGFLGDNSVWLDTFQKMGQDKASKWLQLWDPAVYLPQAKMPMLWVDGTNDFAYPMDSLQKSYRLPEASHTLCVRVRMPHGHGGPGENPEEIHAAAESLFRNGVPLARITGSGRKDFNAWASFKSECPVIKVELNYTTDTGKWQDRKWDTLPAVLDAKAGKIYATLPKATTVYYFNLIDERSLIVSSEHEEMSPDKTNGSDVK
ncbi:MAG: acetylxylan esterase [Candidatus Margulisiibacteriota bacterium]